MFLLVGSMIYNYNLNQKIKEFENIPVPNHLVRSIKENLLYKYFRNNDYEKALHLWNEERTLQEKYQRLKAGAKCEALLSILGLAREISMLIR